LTPDRIPAALFAAAILSYRRDLDARTRISIVSRIPVFDVKSFDEATDALEKAFQVACMPTSIKFPPRGRMAAAAVSTEEWLNKKIFVMSRENFGAQNHDAQHISELVFAFGNASIASCRAATILNSRKPRRISPDDTWITATKSLARYAETAKLTMISSYGTMPYCMVSRLAFSSPLIVVCDDVLPFMSPSQSEDFFFKYGDLFELGSTLFISPFPPGSSLPRDIRFMERDRLVAALASELLVAELSPGGNMEKVVEEASDRGKKVVRYCSSAGATALAARPAAHRKSVPISVPIFREVAGKNAYLIHYTRSCPGPWPGQSAADYCLSLINGCEHSAHSGFDTLCRILSENLIRGSSLLTRRGHCVVSLTERPPSEIPTLTKWRKSLIRWSFEPYGIAFPKDDLFRIGARPVIYAVEDAFQDLSADLEHLFQLQGKNSTDWSAEKEWRVRGDLALNEALREKMIVIVTSQEEAAIVQQEFGYVATLAAACPDSPS
jgi:hypothetical protein